MSDESSGAPEISAVVPLYNEQATVAELHGRLDGALRSLGTSYEIVFVDDGSRDATATRLEALRAEHDHIVVLHLSRNFGHQAAVTAGLDHARGLAVVVLDGDLQDPPEIVPEFVRLWRDGNDVVYAVRKNRKEGLLRRTGYHAFYRILNAISDLEIPLDSGDFCLMDRKVVDSLRDLPECTRFVRGLRTFVGFRQVGLPYDRAARAAGETKYSFAALVRLAVDGLVSFSNYPLRLVTYLGIGTALIGAVLMAWGVVDALHNRTAPRGWASTIVIVLFMGSIQLISLGIIGEYIRLIFLESKRRPSYIVSREARSVTDERAKGLTGHDRDRSAGCAEAGR